MFIVSSFLPARPQEKKIKIPHIIREGLISVASTYGSTSAGALVTSHPREANGMTRTSLGPMQKSHSLPQSSSAAPPFQKTNGAGEWGILIVIWFHLVKNGYQQGPVTLLYHIFALLQISDAEKFPATTWNSRGAQEHAVFTKEHLHLLATEPLKVVLLAGLI